MDFKRPPIKLCCIPNPSIGSYQRNHPSARSTNSMTTLNTAPLDGHCQLPEALKNAEEIGVRLNWGPKFVLILWSLDAFLFALLRKKLSKTKKTKHLWLLNGACPCWRKPHLHIIQRTLRHCWVLHVWLRNSLAGKTSKRYSSWAPKSHSKR